MRSASRVEQLNRAPFVVWRIERWQEPRCYSSTALAWLPADSGSAIVSGLGIPFVRWETESDEVVTPHTVVPSDIGPKDPLPLPADRQQAFLPAQDWELQLQAVFGWPAEAAPRDRVQAHRSKARPQRSRTRDIDGGLSVHRH